MRWIGKKKEKKNSKSVTNGAHIVMTAFERFYCFIGRCSIDQCQMMFNFSSADKKISWRWKGGWRGGVHMIKNRTLWTLRSVDGDSANLQICSKRMSPELTVKTYRSNNTESIFCSNRLFYRLLHTMTYFIYMFYIYKIKIKI